MFRTANPAFKKDEFRPAQTWSDVAGRGGTYATAPTRAEAAKGAMSIGGTVTKTSLLLAMTITTSIVSWNVGRDNPDLAMPLTFGGAIAGFVLALVCSFAPRTTPITAPLYALVEGLFVGGISSFYADRFAVPAAEATAVTPNTGLVFNAGLLTFGIFGGLLAGYGTGIIRPGPVFKKVVITATLGVCLYALFAFVASLFGAFSFGAVFDPSNGGMLSIGVSLLLVGLASANLVLDFDFVENGVKNGAPKYMEWYAGFGLLVTLVWLYIESLRLLAKLQSRD